MNPCRKVKRNKKQAKLRDIRYDLVHANHDHSVNSLLFSAKVFSAIVAILATILLIYGVYHVC